MTFTDHAADFTEPSAHDDAGPAVRGDVDSFASHAELARTLVEPGGVGSLSTLTESGYPFGSVAPFSVLGNGAALVCISSMATHTQNLLRDPRASLLVEQPFEPNADPMSFARATLIGSFVPLEPAQVAIDQYLDVHPHAQSYVGFKDFSWWRLDVHDVRYVGGFGVMGWSSGREFATARPDPVIPHAAPMIDHLNADHSDACLAIVRNVAGVDHAASVLVSAMDRYGITFDAHDLDHERDATVRVAFAEPLDAADQVRAATVALVRLAEAAAA